jgi:formate-dependent nitrite reductase membrane component NrfD
MNAKTARQWMVTHEWMVKPMAQEEWIKGKGLMVWLAEVFSALGTGLYLVSLFFALQEEFAVTAFWAGILGWVGIAVFKLPLHAFYLGKWYRFWRAFPPFSNAWKTSWFARGISMTMIFLAFGALQLIMQGLIAYDVSSSGTVWTFNYIFMVLAGIFGVMTAIYCGFAMSYCKSVPFWNTGLLPLVFLLMGVADGLALTMAVGLVTGVHVTEVAESATRIMLIINSMVILTYLVNANYQSETAELSVKELVRGHVAWVFWLGIVLLGILIPFVISVASYFTGQEATLGLLIFAIVAHTIGAFSLKYGVLKVGIYRPLLPKAHAY